MSRRDDGLAARMAALARRKINDLRAEYTRATGKPANRLGRDALIKALATTHAAPTAARAESSGAARKARERDPRLPAVGGTIEKVFKGKTLRVEVSADGLRCEGKTWCSLTALALHVTGYKAISGPAFFGLAKPAPTSPKPPRKARKE